MKSPRPWVDEAILLYAELKSARKVAAILGKTHKSILYWVTPGQRERQIEWSRKFNRKASAETKLRTRLRYNARLQAAEEGIDPVEVYKRWDVYSPRFDHNSEARA